MAKRKDGGADTDLAACYGEMLELQEESGLSVAEFAENVGLSAGTLYAWRRRLGRRRALAGEEGTATLVEVVPDPSHEESPGSGRMVVTLDRGRRIELDVDFDPAALERLLAVLERC